MLRQFVPSVRISTNAARCSAILGLMLSGIVLCSATAQDRNAVDGDRVRVDNFWIDRTEVTIKQFGEFIQQAGNKTAAERNGGGFEFTAGWTRRPGWDWQRPYGRTAAENEPVVHVSWTEARDFCSAKGGRLPTFTEWRRAAYTETRDNPDAGFERGRTYEYPVGNSPEGMNLSRERHFPVATTKRGVNGLYDMGANVWEWLADRRGDDALTAGGSWWYGVAQTRADAAQWKPANFYAVYVGFRCVYSAQTSS